MIVCGIDPGQSGGIAWYDGEMHAEKMPATEKDVSDLISSIMPDQVFLEFVASRPGQGAPGMFKFGKGYGFLRGVLVSNNIPFTDVTPAKWMGSMGMKKKKNETPTKWKNRLKQLAQQYYPHLKITLATSDAILITQYGRDAIPR